MKKIPGSLIHATFAPQLMEAIGGVACKRGEVFYIAGGTVRDWLLGRVPHDLDIAVCKDAVASCKMLIDVLEGGALVKLGTEEEEAARVVWQGVCVDFSNYRAGAKTIEEELFHRDFTVNAMAVALDDGCGEGALIDPLGGYEDLVAQRLRRCPGAFDSDPLRMLRGYRLQAELGFDLDEECIAEIRHKRSTINGCAVERITAELERIMSTDLAAEAWTAMVESGLAFEFLPELEKGLGMEQPGYHHEDVLYHSLLALKETDRILSGPRKYFQAGCGVIESYLARKSRCRRLRWSALFHDLGKPATRSSGTMDGERTTFYNHDRVGKDMFLEIAARLRMSRKESEGIGRLIDMHMHPFHLSTVRRRQELSRKALLKICRRAGEDLPGLFVLAMADSLASRGPKKPVKSMEEEVAMLFAEVQRAKERYIEPVLAGGPLVNGHDLQKVFGLVPGPHFRRILDEVELAQVEGKIHSRRQALSWLESYLRGHKELRSGQ